MTSENDVGKHIEIQHSKISYKLSQQYRILKLHQYAAFREYLHLYTFLDKLIAPK